MGLREGWGWTALEEAAAAAGAAAEELPTAPFSNPGVCCVCVCGESTIESTAEQHARRRRNDDRLAPTPSSTKEEVCCRCQPPPHTQQHTEHRRRGSVDFGRVNRNMVVKVKTPLQACTDIS